MMHTKQFEGKEIKSDPFTLEAFLKFCESRPADQTYEFPLAAVCACGQYAQTLGVRNWVRTPENHKFWELANVLARGDINGDPMRYRASEWNFGALAQRLRASIGSRSSFWSSFRRWVS